MQDTMLYVRCLHVDDGKSITVPVRMRCSKGVWTATYVSPSSGRIVGTHASKRFTKQDVEVFVRDHEQADIAYVLYDPPADVWKLETAVRYPVFVYRADYAVANGSVHAVVGCADDVARTVAMRLSEAGGVCYESVLSRMRYALERSFDSVADLGVKIVAFAYASDDESVAELPYFVD